MVCVLSLAGTALSQEVRIGGLEGNNAVFGSAAAGTVIDWSRPASATGTVHTASVGWADASTPCDNIFYVRFYGIPGNAMLTVMTAERGPFRAVTGINTVALDPPVNVTTETYIGIRRAEGPESCGRPFGTFTRTPGRALFAAENFTGGSLAEVTPVRNYTLQAQASTSASVRVATLPAVASAPGGFGAFFRTALTLSNPSTFELRGKLVMRLNGQAGSDTDPSLDFVIPANGTLNYADVVEAMGQSGLGSLDILTTASPTPIASARVFNDAGTAGTSGFYEEAVPAGSTYLNNAVIFIPEDLINFRLNIGIRAISASTVTVEIVDAAGTRQSVLFKDYPADYFEQVGSAAFVNGATLPPGGKIVVYAFQKEFMVYGAVTDNRTNDPSMRIGLD